MEIKIYNEKVVGVAFTYRIDFNGWEMLIECYYHIDFGGFEIIIYDLDTEREICILESDDKNRLNNKDKIWDFVLENSHTLLRNIWKLSISDSV